MASVEIEKFTGSDGTDYLFRDTSKLKIISSAAAMPDITTSFVSYPIKISYQSGVTGSFVRLWDVTSFKDGTIVNLNNDNVNFKGFFIAGKNQGTGSPVVVEIACKVAYNQTTHYLYSSSSGCGPRICSRMENGIKKYYLGIYYDSTLYADQGASLCGLFSRVSSNKDFSHKAFLGDYTPWVTYPGGEHLWTTEYTWTGLVSAKSLMTARNLGVNLARTAASSFDGSANQLDIPVKGVLPVANGGTGAATSGDARRALDVYSKKEVDDAVREASEVGNARKLFDYNDATQYIIGQYETGSGTGNPTFKLYGSNSADVVVDKAANAEKAGSASTADTATKANGVTIQSSSGSITSDIVRPVIGDDDIIRFGTNLTGKTFRVDSAGTSDNSYALQSSTDFNHRWSSPNFDHVNANRAFCRVDVATTTMGDARPVKNDGSKGDGYLLTLNWDGATTADCQLCIFNGTTNGGQPVIRWHKNDGTWTAWQGLRARGFADQNGTQADFYFSNDSGQSVSPDYSFSAGSQDTPHMLCVIKDAKENRQIVNVLASKITVQKAKEAAVTTVSSGTVSLAASAYANTGGHWSIVSGATISGGPNTSMALPVLLETILMGSWYSVQRVTDANGDCWTRVVKSNSSRTSWKKMTP